MLKLFVLIFKIVVSLIVLIGLAILLSYRSDIDPEVLVEKYSSESSYFVHVEGMDLHVKVKGEGEPIFLIHGSFSSLHAWQDWEEELSQYFMTISMDLPGHGLTGPDPQKRYNVNDYASLLFVLADNLGLEEFHIAGNSMGGGVALKMASDKPERVLSLNLIDSSGAPRKISDNTEPTAKRKNTTPSIIRLAQTPLFSKILLKCTPEFLFSRNLKQVYYDQRKIKPQQVTRYYELMRREGNRQATIDRLTSRKPLEIDFEKIKMPVLITWGREDTWIPLANGNILAEAIPGSKLKVFDQAGHVPMEEIPTETVAEYLSFLGIQSNIDYFSAPKYYSHVGRKSNLFPFVNSDISSLLPDL
ncbi:alpha/beta hydrolase [Belliella sp. DSM 107340]|uniref:Alpha/beta hydrolase n=1 Tax=Belliella calami TaxID=2923436 RepID=A0ABS9USA0_9BACT|nr:alpha/beta hydrolase [Belliella calami]MCH7399479.1 alpha/beta hydrolase [Belliella calami]